MEGYLGTKLVNWKTHPEYSSYTKNDWAMLFIEMYGQIDGDHHKSWVLDQVSRILKDTPIILNVASWDNGQSEDRISTGEASKEYLKWVEDMKGSIDSDGEYMYSYTEGIAP